MLVPKLNVLPVILLLLPSIQCQAIDPSTVPSGIRDTWCTTQKSSCPLLCTQIGASTDTQNNDCDPETLNFSCVCSNGLMPNASEYSQTIPYFECTETANQCANNCGSGNDNCVTQCRTARPCGAQDPKRVNLTTTTASISATATGSMASSSATNNYGGFGGPNSPESTDTSAARSSKLRASSAWSETLGLIFISGGFLAGFAILL